MLWKTDYFIILCDAIDVTSLGSILCFVFFLRCFDLLFFAGTRVLDFFVAIESLLYESEVESLKVIIVEALVKKTKEAFLEILLHQLFLSEFRAFYRRPPIANLFNFR